MALTGWILDKSAAARANEEVIGAQLAGVGALFLCPVGELEQLYATTSARDYDTNKEGLHRGFTIVPAPTDVLDRALELQHDLAHHHGMWHRIPIPDLLISVTALHHGLGIVHVDSDFERIAEVRPLRVRRLG